MKNYLLSLLVILSNCAIAQSKKERYAQLLGEMNTAQQKYDSVKNAYGVKHGVLETKFISAERKIRELENLETGMKELFRSIKEKTAILDDIEVDYTAILDKKTLQTSGQTGSRMKRLRTVSLNKIYFPHLDTVRLKDLKTGQKNERITKQLVVLNGETQKCMNQIQIDQAGIDSLLNMNQQFDDNLAQNSELTGKLRVIDEQLNKKLMELETAYLKEPKKFNKNCEKYFPLVKDDVDEPFGAVPAPKELEHIETRQPEIFDVVEEPATFPGGMEALRKYLVENIKYPQTAKDQGISGKVYLKFIVSDKGAISNVKIMKGVSNCPECDQEAIRVVRNMPKWIPAKDNGKVVNSYFTLPVQFKL
nr:energy transducer TonB [uncultured Fluviicola sp.]